MNCRAYFNSKSVVGLSLALCLATGVYFFFYQHNQASETPQPHLAITAVVQSASQTDAISDSYQSWKSTYVVPATSTAILRVRRPENGNDTVSEGIGTGMLLSVSLKDKATFDGLWQYAKQHMNTHGLMAWHIDAQGNILDNTAATDADEDMAYALVAADIQWGGYTTDATALLQQIALYEVESGTNVLQPGDTWGGSDVTSPSYLSPAYYDTFLQYTHDDTWDKVSHASNSMLAAIQQNTPVNKTGLLSDWSTSYGTPVTIYTDKDYYFGYKSTKAIWRLGLAAVWEKDQESQAILTSFAGFFQNMPNNQIVDGYTIDGAPFGGSNNTAFVDAVTIAKTLTNQKSVAPIAAYQIANSYYEDSYHLLTELLLSHSIPHVVLK